MNVEHPRLLEDDLTFELERFRSWYDWPKQTLRERAISEAAARRYVLRAGQPPENPVDAFALLLQHRRACRRPRFFKAIRRLNALWGRWNRIRSSVFMLAHFLRWWLDVLERQRIEDCLKTQQSVRRHPDRKKARDKRYKRENTEKVGVRIRRYLEATREIRLQRDRERRRRYRLAHPVVPRPKKTPEELAASRRESKRRSRIKDRLIRRLAERVRQALRRGHTRKQARTIDLIGCTPPELWAHLERQFRPGMTRENYGRWHVDHIRPCASFDLRDLEQQRQCFHFSNLQPLWALDNLKKSARWGDGSSSHASKTGCLHPSDCGNVGP